MRNHKNLPAYAALFIVCLVWGTAYFAIRIGVRTFPPFLFSAIRQTTAGGVLLAGLALTGNLKVAKQDIWQQSVSGILLLALGNGVIGWCERTIASGLAALVLSLIPVFVVAISYLLGFDKRKPHKLLVVGLLLGCLGIALIFSDNVKDITDPRYFKGLLTAFGACVAIAFGAVYAKHNASNNTNVLQNAALQLFSAGITLFIFSAFLDDYSELGSISATSIQALIYLVVFGSIMAYTCFVYALKHLPIGVASLYAYVNPFIAIAIGFFFLHEPLTGMTLFALTAALSGVYCINKGYLKMAERDEANHITVKP